MAAATGPDLRTLRTALRRDPVARRLAARWRALTGGHARGQDADRRTLVACSAGADSSALALALWAAAPARADAVVIAHVLHDLRPRAEAQADADAARALAARLGVPFVLAHVRARRSGTPNLEAAARKARYRALARLAREHRCPVVATAHHADDQLETILMALIRGSGPRGLAGVAEARPLTPSGPTLIRPALTTGRDELRHLCQLAGWAWREDATNADTTRTRAAVRAHILPAIKALRPRVAHRAARAADLQRDAAALIDAHARHLLAAADRPAPGALRWTRAALRAHPAVVLGAALRLAATRHADRLTSRTLSRAAACIRSAGTDPLVIQTRPFTLRVTARDVTLTPRA